jgi:hypothetical protein
MQVEALQMTFEGLQPRLNGFIATPFATLTKWIAAGKIRPAPKLPSASGSVLDARRSQAAAIPSALDVKDCNAS